MAIEAPFKVFTKSIDVKIFIISIHFHFCIFFYISIFISPFPFAFPATWLKRDSNTGNFLWILRNFLEQLFWRPSANDCFYNCQLLFHETHQNNPRDLFRTQSVIYRAFWENDQLWKLLTVFVKSSISDGWLRFECIFEPLFCLAVREKWGWNDYVFDKNWGELTK